MKNMVLNLLAQQVIYTSLKILHEKYLPDKHNIFFIQHIEAGADGGGQSLVSPGSCLEEFRSVPFIACNSLGRCNYHNDAYSFWLTTIEDRNMFRKPKEQLLKGAGLSRTKVSRCSVCLRQKEPRYRALPPYNV